MVATMGMDSAKLSARAKQPGHDVTFRESEANFVKALKEILDESEWRIEDKPRELAKMLGGKHGLLPEASITFKPTGRIMYFEVKKQGERGNADERAAKHHTVQFYKELQKVTGLDYHAYATIFCESLATFPKYTVKQPYFFEEDHYFRWKDYDLDLLADYIAKIAAKWLMHSKPTPPDAIPQ